MLAAALGSTLAVSTSKDHHDNLALVPTWLKTYKAEHAKKENLDVQAMSFREAAQFTLKRAERYTGDGALVTTAQKPMTDEDVKTIVASLIRGGKQDVQSAADILDIEKDDQGGSVRLGNLIDLWWYELNYPTTHRGTKAMSVHKNGVPIFLTFNEGQWDREIFNVAGRQCGKSKSCFGRFLATSALSIRNETAMHHPDSGFAKMVRERTERSPKLQKLQTVISQRYGIYQPHTVRDQMMPEMGNDLGNAFKIYASMYDPKLLVAPKTDAVVHYRVGDALSNEAPVHPRSIAKALASLSPQPKTIEVLNGGFNFQPDKAMSIKFSVYLLKVLSDEILAALPNAKVIMPTAQSVRASSVDQDWAKLVNAKMMVAGAGSFGLSAAVARNHSLPEKQTRTPAYWHGVYPCSTKHYQVDEEWLVDQDFDAADTAMQIPPSGHKMHPSGRWSLFSYNCACKADALHDTVADRAEMLPWADDATKEKLTPKNPPKCLHLNQMGSTSTSAKKAAKKAPADDDDDAGGDDNDEQSSSDDGDDVPEEAQAKSDDQDDE